MKRAIRALPLLLLVLLGCRRLYFRYLDPSLTLTFFDVGQGDAALLQFPRGRSLLIDAGGGWGDRDLGTTTLFPELARLGILHLDAALMTHPDQDHAYGFRGLFGLVSIDSFWFNAAFAGDPNPSPLFLELLRTARARKIRLEGITGRERREWHGVAVTLLALQGGAQRGSKTNDRSLVALLEFAGCSMLFAADLQAPAEAELARWLGRHVDLLKVAHHGSKTSSSEGFLRWATPRWAVISVGGRNRYGHPHRRVLRRLRAHGVDVLRTDFHGYVRFIFTPEGEVRCESALGDCGVSQCQETTRSFGGGSS